MSSVSLAYKESANCRLEANYISTQKQSLTCFVLRELSSQVCLHLQGMQNECDMVPLMMQSKLQGQRVAGSDPRDALVV